MQRDSTPNAAAWHKRTLCACTLGGPHFKAVNFLSQNAPRETTEHLERPCQHSPEERGDAHEPCTGRAADGRSRTAVSAAYSPSLLTLLVFAALAMLPMSAPVQIFAASEAAESTLNDNGIDMCWGASTLDEYETLPPDEPGPHTTAECVAVSWRSYRRHT